MKTKKQLYKKGFTLVELLVVLAIIGVLVSLIVPAVFKSLERGKIAKCSSSMKQINNGLLAYISIDNDRTIPEINDPKDIFTLLIGHIGNAPAAYLCPSQSGNSQHCGTYNNQPYCVHYYLNPNAADLKMSQIKNPSWLVTLYEFTNENELPHESSGNRGANFAFLDGRVEFINQTDMDEREDPENERGWDNWGTTKIWD